MRSQTLTTKDVRANLQRWREFADAHWREVSLGARIDHATGESYLWARTGNGKECVVSVPRNIAEAFPYLDAARAALADTGDIVQCATCGRWVVAGRAEAHSALHSAAH